MSLPPNKKLPIVLTMGDPAGIGPDLALQIWLQHAGLALPAFCVIGCLDTMRQRASVMGLDIALQDIQNISETGNVFDAALPVLPLPCQNPVSAGIADNGNAEAVIGSIEQAVSLVQGGAARAVVTNPINKEVLYDAGFRFPGHTEFLASLASVDGQKPIFPVMMLASKQLNVVPVTIHIALSQVSEKLTQDLLIKTCQITRDAFRHYFGLERPRLAIAGLNPHAGEGGSMGMQEKEIIIPAIEKMRKMGLEVSGPHPADTLFHEEARQKYDVVMGMYHDQVLIPIKTLAFDSGVNVTLGLPFVRTSPDHGTAYDIAGTGKANPRSLVEAIKMASRMTDGITSK